MNDVELIRETLGAPPPSTRATAQARNRLTSAIAAQQQPRRARRWVLSGAGALAGVVALVLAGTLPGGPPEPAPQVPALSALSARDILLAAADRAATEP